MTGPSDVEKKINNLNAGWRNVVSEALRLDKNTFQLAQGTLGLQTDDSSGMFEMADGVPPYSAIGYYDASGKDKRSTSYNMLLHALLPSTAGGMRKALGPMYAKWTAYRQSNIGTTKTQVQLFNEFADAYLDPTQKTAGESVYAAAASDPLNLALNAYVDTSFQTKFVNSAGDNFSLPTYTGDISTAQSMINNSSSVDINFDSNTMDTSSNGTTVEGAVSGFFDIFAGEAGADFTQLSTKAAASRFTVTGTIGQNATVPTTAGGWYVGSELGKAYNAKNDFTIWDADANQGDWDSFFGQENGILARRMSQLILVSDYTLTVTSEASYSQSDLTSIKTEAGFGIWPFFFGEVVTTHTQKSSIDANGHLSVTTTLDKGKIQIWGATIESAPN